jgi:hypothetical protein
LIFPSGPPKYPLDPTSSNQQLLKILQNNKTSPSVYSGLPTKNLTIQSGKNEV